MTENAVRVPVGYDFRISALDNTKPIGVNFSAYEDMNMSAEIDKDGFYLAADDFSSGNYVIEEYFMIPTDEIRVEKVVTNTETQDDFVFTATRTYPVTKKIHEDTNEKDYSKFENIVIPLKNYAYSLYSSDTDELLGTYKTDENGEFKLNAYEFFCCWNFWFNIKE